MALHAKSNQRIHKHKDKRSFLVKPFFHITKKLKQKCICFKKKGALPYNKKHF